LPEQRCAGAFGVLVEGLADPGGRQLVHECAGRYDGASVTGSSGQPG
jgi:hypothetical protein